MEVTENTLKKIESYEKDKDKFYLLNLISETVGKLLSSDNATYIIGRSRVGLPTWIWTLDDIEKVNLESLENDLKKYIEESENKITCKKELYDKLKERYETSDYFEMGFLLCKKLKDVTLSNGFLDKPNYGDKVTLAKYWQANCKEMYQEEFPFEKALEEAEHFLDLGTFYVWRNAQGRAVSMASYSTVEDQAKITHVFTPKEERKKGYCKSLVYCLTKSLLEKELVPLLYTDYHYKPSNEAYKKVGYEPQGYLVNFKIKKRER